MDLISTQPSLAREVLKNLEDAWPASSYHFIRRGGLTYVRTYVHACMHAYIHMYLLNYLFSYLLAYLLTFLHPTIP